MSQAKQKHRAWDLPGIAENFRDLEAARPEIAATYPTIQKWVKSRAKSVPPKLEENFELEAALLITRLSPLEVTSGAKSLITPTEFANALRMIQVIRVRTEKLETWLKKQQRASETS